MYQLTWQQKQVLDQLVTELEKLYIQVAAIQQRLHEAEQRVSVCMRWSEGWPIEPWDDGDIEKE